MVNLQQQDFGKSFILKYKLKYNFQRTNLWFGRTKAQHRDRWLAIRLAAF